MGALIGVAVLVLDVVAIVDVLGSGKDSEKKGLWVAVILLLPLAGMLLYFLAGKKAV